MSQYHIEAILEAIRMTPEQAERLLKSGLYLPQKLHQYVHNTAVQSARRSPHLQTVRILAASKARKAKLAASGIKLAGE